jgi:hypothetical protein
MRRGWQGWCAARYGRAVQTSGASFKHNLADIYRVMTVFNLRRAIGLAGL